MGTHNNWGVIAAVVAALFATTACSDAEERSVASSVPSSAAGTDAPTTSTAPPTTPAPTSTAAPTTTEPPPVTPSWTLDIAPASALVASGDVVAFYTSTTGDRLEVVAVGADDGAIRWRHPATLSEIYLGIASSPVAVGDRIVAIAPRSDGGDGGFVVLHGYDPATGEVVWVSEPFITRNGPHECDDAPQVCMVGYLESDPATARDLRFDPATGALVASTAVGESGDSLDGDLMRTPDGVALLDRATGAFSWQATYADIFGTRPVNSGFGYDAYFDGVTNTFVLSFGADPAASGDVTQWDQSLVSMAGLDASTGAVKWLEDGVTWLCRLGFHHDSRDGVGQRCRQRGTVHLQPVGETSYDITGTTDLAVSIEVFDLGTGATIGTPLDLALPSEYMNPGAGAAAVYAYPPVDVGDDTIAGLTPAGAAVLDLRSGALTPVSPDVPGWCSADGTPFVLGGQTRYPGDFATPCLVGSREPAASVPDPVDRVGVHAGGSFVWSNGSSVSAIPAG